MNKINKIKLLIYCISLYIFIGLVTIAVTENISDREVNKETLYDLIHEITPAFPTQRTVTYIVYFFILYTFFRWGYFDLNKVSLFFFSLAVIYLLRLFTFTFTQTPPPSNKDNQWRIDHCKRTILSSFGISLKKISSACIDNMFSGHASNIVVALTIILLYSKYKTEKIVLSLLGILSLITVITGRLHYSSDVIVATIISSLTVFFISKTFKVFSE